MAPGPVSPGQPVIRLNEEVRGQVLAEVGRDAQVGEEVYLEDIVRIGGFEPEPDERVTPYIAAFAHGTGWAMSNDLSRATRARTSTSRLASTSPPARARHTWPDGSASPSTARTRRPSCWPRASCSRARRPSRPRCRRASTRASSRRTRCGRGSATPTSASRRCCTASAKLRPAARYPNAELAADDKQFAELMGTLAEMERHVRGVVSRDPAYRRRRYQVIATREIRAGRLARDSDCTIVPPKVAST